MVSSGEGRSPFGREAGGGGVNVSVGRVIVSAQARIRPRGIHLMRVWGHCGPDLFDRPEEASSSENVIPNRGVWNEPRSGDMIRPVAVHGRDRRGVCTVAWSLACERQY